MIDIKFQVTYNGDQHEVTAGPVTQVAFEREFKRSIASIGDTQMVSDMYWLAWHALSVRVKCGTFDEFLAGLDEFEMVSTDSAVPLDEAASSTSSAG